MFYQKHDNVPFEENLNLRESLIHKIELKFKMTSQAGRLR